MNRALKFVPAGTLHRKADRRAGIGIHEHSSYASSIREDSTGLNFRRNSLKHRRVEIMPHTIFIANCDDSRGVQHQWGLTCDKCEVAYSHLHPLVTLSISVCEDTYR